MSASETEILRWYARGLTTRQVSELTGLSANTIKTYTRRAMDELDAATHGQAIAKFIEHDHQ
nr:helix-turn-helix transcriptional regulator [Bifidobacterium phasiani]